MDDFTPYDLAACAIFVRSVGVLEHSPRAISLMCKIIREKDVYVALQVLEVVGAMLDYIHTRVSIPPLYRYDDRLLAIENAAQRAQVKEAVEQIFAVYVADFRHLIAQSGGYVGLSRSLN